MGDQSAYFQSLINSSGEVELPAGTFQAKNLVVSGNKRLIAHDRGTVFIPPDVFSDTDELMTNANRESFTDFNISLEGIVFDGMDAGASGTRRAELVGWKRVTRGQMIDVEVRNAQWIGAALNACRDCTTTRLYAHGLGYQGSLPHDQTAEGGAAVWISNTEDAETGFGNKIIDAQIDDNNWTGLLINGRDNEVRSPVIRRCREAGIFSPDTNNDGLKVSDAQIEDIVQKAISGSGIEAGGKNLHILGGRYKRLDHSAITLTDVQTASVMDAIMSEFNILGTPHAGGVTIIGNAASPDQPKDIMLMHNHMFDIQTVVTGWAAIAFGGTGDQCSRIMARFNNFHGVSWASGSSVVTASHTDGTCVISDNIG